MENKDYLVNLAQVDHKDKLGKEERLDQQDPLDHKVHLAHQEAVVNLGHRVSKVKQAARENAVSLVRPDQQAP